MMAMDDSCWSIDLVLISTMRFVYNCLIRSNERLLSLSQRNGLHLSFFLLQPLHALGYTLLNSTWSDFRLVGNFGFHSNIFCHFEDSQNPFKLYQGHAALQTMKTLYFEVIYNFQWRLNSPSPSLFTLSHNNKTTAIQKNSLNLFRLTSKLCSWKLEHDFPSPSGKRKMNDG